MKFGIYIRPTVSYTNMLELTHLAEQLGYYGVFLNDHVHGFKQNGKEPYIEAWTAISGLGVQTTKIRLGHIVLFNSLRNPAFLAKSITTLDNMTNGRYETLIGSGWNEPEYLGYDLMERGRGMPSAKERVDRFTESLEILRGMFSNEVFSYQGQYWTLKDAINIPQPIQKPMKISVGAEKSRMIKTSVRLGDGLNLVGGLDNIVKGGEILFPALEKYHKSIDDFYLSGFTSLSISKTNKIYNEQVNELSNRSNKSKEDIKKYAFVGTPEILVDKINQAKDLGMKMMVISPQPAETLDERKNLLADFKDKIIS